MEKFNYEKKKLSDRLVSLERDKRRLENELLNVNFKIHSTTKKIKGE
jgi:hypothetical protein